MPASISNILSSPLTFAATLFILFFTTCAITGSDPVDTAPDGVTYYFNAQDGDDQHTGTTPEQAWKSLSALQHVDLQPGDQVLLAAGQVFRQPLLIHEVSGTADQPVRVSTYGTPSPGTGRYAHIHTAGDLNGIHILNSSFIEVEHVSVTAGPVSGETITTRGSDIMRVGIRVDVTEFGIFEHIQLRDLEVKDVFYEQPGFDRGSTEVNTANGTQSYGWGIRFFNTSNGGLLRDLLVDSVQVTNVAHTGIKLTAPRQGEDYGIKNFIISNSTVTYTGGPGIQMSGVFNGHIVGNAVDRSGSEDDSRKWGRGSGLWTWSTANVLIEKNRFTNANGPGDSAGAHIDFNCRNVILQYNFSANNAGGFCEILGNNYNCSYRYNISVNDGHRVKGQDGAFQEGKILWLSGYNGNTARKGPFNSYIYNNTIFVDERIQAKMAIDRVSDGILIANNIFHIVGDAISVLGDQYNPETGGSIVSTNTTFRNNLFLHQKSWPVDYPWADTSPAYGNAAFSNAGGMLPEDYIPSASDLIQDKGSVITPLQGDETGLYLGLGVETDILGNPIVGAPDIGAIEIQ
jgi:hypothetical protein